MGRSPYLTRCTISVSEGNYDRPLRVELFSNRAYARCTISVSEGNYDKTNSAHYRQRQNFVALFPFLKGITTKEPPLNLPLQIQGCTISVSEGNYDRIYLGHFRMSHTRHVALFPFLKGITTHQRVKKFFHSLIKISCTISVSEGNYDKFIFTYPLFSFNRSCTISVSEGNYDRIKRR